MAEKCAIIFGHGIACRQFNVAEAIALVHNHRTRIAVLISQIIGEYKTGSKSEYVFRVIGPIWRDDVNEIRQLRWHHEFLIVEGCRCSAGVSFDMRDMMDLVRYFSTVVKPEAVTILNLCPIKAKAGNSGDLRLSAFPPPPQSHSLNHPASLITHSVIRFMLSSTCRTSFRLSRLS